MSGGGLAANASDSLPFKAKSFSPKSARSHGAPLSWCPPFEGDSRLQSLQNLQGHRQQQRLLETPTLSGKTQPITDPLADR